VSTSPATEPDGTPEAAPPSIIEAVGGPLGIAETVSPALVFVIVYTAAGNDITTSGICAVAVALVLGLARVVRRQTPIYALSGVIGVAISAYIAHRTGKAENFFLLGFLLNIGYAGAFLVSMAVRWPLIGVLVSALSKADYSWRNDPVLMKAYNRATAVWAILFLARLVVQLPLYFADALVALGAARIGMGVPLFVVGVWFSWLLLRNTPGGVPWARAVKAAERPPVP
jgi:hypothetical protein